MLKNRILIIFALLSLIYGCSNRRELKKEVDAPIKDPFYLKGKKVSSIDSILIDKKCSNVVFLFNYYDCSSCVDLGFSITKRIDSLYKRKKVMVVSTMGNPSSYQKRNGYYEYVYSDAKDLIRKELKYVPTPILFSLDSSNNIKDYVLPGSSTEKEITSFINKVMLWND